MPIQTVSLQHTARLLVGATGLCVAVEVRAQGASMSLPPSRVYRLSLDFEHGQYVDLQTGDDVWPIGDKAWVSATLSEGVVEDVAAMAAEGALPL